MPQRASRHSPSSLRQATHCLLELGPVDRNDAFVQHRNGDGPANVPFTCLLALANAEDSTERKSASAKRAEPLSDNSDARTTEARP